MYGAVVITPIAPPSDRRVLTGKVHRDNSTGDVPVVATEIATTDRGHRHLHDGGLWESRLPALARIVVLVQIAGHA